MAKAKKVPKRNVGKNRAKKLRPKKDGSWPWCAACNSWHDPKNPTCLNRCSCDNDAEDNDPSKHKPTCDYRQAVAMLMATPYFSVNPREVEVREIETALLNEVLKQLKAVAMIVDGFGTRLATLEQQMTTLEGRVAQLDERTIGEIRLGPPMVSAEEMAKQVAAIVETVRQGGDVSSGDEVPNVERPEADRDPGGG